MKVLSLFDGISCFRVALGAVPDLEYLASEIDKNAIKVSSKNYPTIKQLGNVKDISGVDGVDILVGGSPCTDLSIAKKEREGLKGSRSKLFFEYVRLLKECKPKWFILENVASMKEDDKKIITEALGVQPIMIDARLVSAQTRKRLFWTNIPIKGLPEDRGIVLKDILQAPEEVDSKYTVKGKFTKIEKKARDFHQIGYIGEKNTCGVGGQALRVYSTETKSSTLGTSGAGLIQIGHIGPTNMQGYRVYDTEGKSVTLTANSGGVGGKTGLIQIGHIGPSNGQANRVYDTEGKSVTLTANGGGSGAKTGLYGMSIRAHQQDKGGKWINSLEVRKDDKVSAITSSHTGKLALVGQVSNGVVDTLKIRKLTPIECERLMGLPDNYTDAISMTGRYKAIGNAFHVDVMKWILSFIPK